MNQRILLKKRCHRFASITPWAYLLREVLTPCFDMKEKRDRKNALVCETRWSAFLEVASDLARASYSKCKSITWLIPSHARDESTTLFRDMEKESREEAGTWTFFLWAISSPSVTKYPLAKIIPFIWQIPLLIGDINSSLKISVSPGFTGLLNFTLSIFINNVR